MSDLPLADVKNMIRDAVREALATRAIDALEHATEDVKKAKHEGRDILAQLRAQADGPVIPSKDDRGLDFTRQMKAEMVGKAEGRDAKDVAHAWGKRHKHYAAIADQISQSREQRSLSEGAFASGGSLVPPPAMGEFIELTYAQTLALEMGANRVEINRTLDLGKQTGGVTTYYVDELQNITPSTPSTGKVALAAKKLAAVVLISNELLRNPSAGADRMVRNSMVRAMANRRDLSFFRGTGASGQPRGMLNWAAAGNTDTQGGTTVADKVADTIAMIRMVDEGNVGLESAGFVMAPRTRWGLAATYDSTTGLVFASMLASQNLWGFPVGSTTAIPKNLGGGGAESEIHFGNFGETILAFDENTPTTVELFPNGTYHDGANIVSGISNDSSIFRILEGHDCALKIAEAWATLTAVTWA